MARGNRSITLQSDLVALIWVKPTDHRKQQHPAITSARRTAKGTLIAAAFIVDLCGSAIAHDEIQIHHDKILACTVEDPTKTPLNVRTLPNSNATIVWKFENGMTVKVTGLLLMVYESTKLDQIAPLVIQRDQAGYFFPI
jgi:hypothetical protein